MMNEQTRKHNEHCKSIAETLKKYASGDYILYLDELYLYDEFEETETADGETVYTHPDFIDALSVEEYEQLEPVTIYDYFSNTEIYNTNYILDSYKELEAVRVMIACGGPNIYIDTWDREIKLKWWSESGSWFLDNETCDAINDYFIMMDF